MSLGTARAPVDRAVASVPPATRTARPGWRDPRLWIGVLLVAVSVVAGARLLAAADDSVSVWAVATDAGPGTLLTSDDLVAHRVRFADPDQLAGYFTVDDELPADLRLVRPVTAGELLPRAALGADADGSPTPSSCRWRSTPTRCRPRCSPARWSTSTCSTRTRRSASPGPVLAAATVVDAPALETGFGAVTGRRQLVLAVPADDATAFFAALGRLDSPVLTVVRRG